MLRRSFRILVALAAVTGAFALNMAPASAAPGAAVAVFSAPAHVGQAIYAPVGFNPTDCPGALPGLPGPCRGANTTFSFDSNNTTLGASACVSAYADAGALVGVGVSVNGSPTAGSCRLQSSGNVGPVAATAGAWCGLSAGSGTAQADVTGAVVGTSVSANVTVTWLTSAGTVLPLVFTPGGNTAVGVGAVQTTGPVPGPCGLNPTNPAGATDFQVTGFSALVVVA